jgi:hypothetical protein
MHLNSDFNKLETETLHDPQLLTWKENPQSHPTATIPLWSLEEVPVAIYLYISIPYTKVS